MRCLGRPFQLITKNRERVYQTLQKRFKTKDTKKPADDLSKHFNPWENPLYSKKFICTMADLSKYDFAYREFDVVGIWTGFVYLDPRTGELQGFTNNCPNGGHELTYTGRFFSKNKDCIHCQACNWTFDFESGQAYDEEGFYNGQSLRPLIVNNEDENVYLYMDSNTFRRPGIGSGEVWDRAQ